jgi:hypothetical protein
MAVPAARAFLAVGGRLLVVVAAVAGGVEVAAKD